MADKKYRRTDGRRVGQLRPVTITPGFVGTADGSCLIEVGGTRIICTASIDPDVPPWRKEQGLGWVTAEYGMLPASTGRRKSRPILKNDGRAVEIQRLIGRALRSVVRFDKLGPNTIYLDCDVLQADGGTRTASITGAYVALAQAVAKGRGKGMFARGALQGAVAAISVGVVEGTALLDMCYAEDSVADVDMNIAMTSGGKYIEIQGTSEAAPFDAEQLQTMLKLGQSGVGKLLQLQKKALKEN
ncbi:MAG: ribonuclease PH [Planctomycetota bacterium]|nr:MAG: ribonuclease PH [Planctomycetota bacterium]